MIADCGLSVIFDIVFVLLLMVILLAPVVSSADATLDELVGKLENRYQSIDSLRANFAQSYRSKRFSDAISERGVVYFRRGGLMKWEYEQPEKKVFVSDGQFYYYYVERDKQVVKAPVSNAGQNSPTLFLAGRGDFLRDFRAEWADPRPGSHRIKMTPVKPQPDFRYLIVDIDPVRGLVLQLDVVDEYDNRTEYTFQRIAENPKLPSDFFTFHVPPGTDVIFQRSEKE